MTSMITNQDIPFTAAVNAGARMDRLPIGPFHRRMLWLVSMGVFFDSFDNTLSSSVLAALLQSGWSTLELNSLFMSVTFAGLMVGALMAGWLSDRFGRRFAYQFNLAIFGLCALVSAFAPSMQALICIRAIMSVGMGAEYVMGYGLITEFVPPKERGRYIGWFAVFAGVGVFVTAMTALLVIPTLGWRAMFFIGGVGTMWVWWERRKLPESPRWLEKVGRAEEAEKVLQGIEQEAAQNGPLPPIVVAPTSPPRHVSAAVLLTRPVIGRTLLAIIVSITCLFGSYTMTGWMPTFLVKQGLTVTKSLAYNTTMMAGFAVGSLLVVLLADRIGRRWGIVMFGIICAILGSIYPFLTSPPLIMLCGFLLTAGAAVFLFLGSGIAPEFFPTEYRFRGAGVAQMFGRAGLIASPFIILTLFDRYGVGGVIGAIAGMYVAVALIFALFGIETNQRSLEALEPETTPNTSTGAILRAAE
ncbi:MFS transporter [Bradyrhizobium sp. UFLA05-112]